MRVAVALVLMWLGAAGFACFLLMLAVARVM